MKPDCRSCKLLGKLQELKADKHPDLVGVSFRRTKFFYDWDGRDRVFDKSWKHQTKRRHQHWRIAS